jgi:hypothetical protein
MIGALLRRLSSRLGRRDFGMPAAPVEPDPSLPIPPDIDRRLNRAHLVPLLEAFRHRAPGPPGISQGRPGEWVARDERGRVIGVLRAYDFDGLISLDVEVDPAHRRQGIACRLYAAASAAGIDVEKGSRTSLATGLMTPLGYAFFAGRRAKPSDPPQS